jgi:hypothetical protein
MVTPNFAGFGPHRQPAAHRLIPLVPCLLSGEAAVLSNPKTAPAARRQLEQEMMGANKNQGRVHLTR